MKRENVDYFMALAKEYANAERELRIQAWVYISIERVDANDLRSTRLFFYDLPRDLYEKRKWVVRWRVAKLQCQYPRDTVRAYYSYYDKRLGKDSGPNGCLRRLASLKAKCTIQQRNIDAYVAYHKDNDLFFHENTDQDLIRLREKLAAKLAEVQAAEERMKLKIEQVKQQ